MRKNIILQSLACLALFAGVACSQEPLQSGENGEGLKITISCGQETKATPTQDGVGNENLIKTVDVFLFHTAGEKYTHRFHEEPGALTNYTMYIGSSFATDGDYTIFTIVNYPYTTLADLDTDFGTNGNWAEHKTLAELQALALSESSKHTFTQGASAPFSLANEENLALVMTGEADGVHVSTSSGTNIIGTASIELKRLASKVTMDFYLQDELVNNVKGDGSIIETWTPITEGHAIRAYLCNGNESIQLGGTGSPSLFDYKPDTNIKSIAGKTGFKAAFSMPAFYTYPESWTKGDANEPYIKLIVQWQLARTTAGGTSTSQKETYYKVMLPDAVTAFESNKWYNFELDVTQLGATSESDAVPVVPSYLIAAWGNENIVISTLVPSYYLSVSDANKNLDFYTDKVEIPFTSSGDVAEFGSGSTKSSITVTYTDYSTATPTPATVDAAAALAMVTIDNTKNLLVINRPIANNFPADYDVCRYVFHINLHLEDADARYDEELIVTQYPPLFITSEPTGPASNSKNTVYVNGNYSQDPSNWYYYVWDNADSRPDGAPTSSNKFRSLGYLEKPEHVASAASNNNLNLYTITATNISLQVEYDGGFVDAVIGDPRAAATDDTSPYYVLTGGGATGLTGYRPTAENTKNVIAPKFMVASSMGKTMAMTYEGAQKRCAAYQEFGYPAGRWRVPTIAEIAFMLQLDNDMKIPSLFLVDGNSTRHQGYWAAGQEVYSDLGFVDLAGVTPGMSGMYAQYTKNPPSNVPFRGAVRCVYDIWYWGDSHSNTTSNSWLGFKPNLTDTF